MVIDLLLDIYLSDWVFQYDDVSIYTVKFRENIFDF